MSIVVAALVVVGGVAALNLLLTFGVIRRLREHTDLLADGGGGRVLSTMAGAGESIDPFSATSVEGSVVSSDRFDGPALVGVLAVGCDVCEEKLPAFLERAAEFRQVQRTVLAVVVAADDVEGAPYINAVADVATVVRENRDGPVAAALRVTGYPAFGIVDAGIVSSSAVDPARLRVGSLA